MKKKYFPLLGLIVFFLATAFTTYVTVSKEYEASDLTDLSFQERLAYHGDEMYALDNYYTNVQNNRGVVDDYNSIMADFRGVILQQKQYMENNNITFDQVRNNPSILPVNFQVSDAQYSKIQNIINTTKSVSSPYLKESLTTLKEYIDLARKPNIKYSQLEIYKDATGDGLIRGQVQRKSSNNQTKGLKSREAVRKLMDLLKNPRVFEAGQVSVYPNPITETSRISFLNTAKGNVEFFIYDLNGKKIHSATKKVEQGNVTIDLQNLLNKKLTNGLFILKIKNVEGKVLTQKIVSK